MRAPDYPDCFVVVNGPEDGTEFPIVRGPFYIGHDPSCMVNIRLDPAVRSFHALVSVVSDGYRVRRSDETPVYVNGRRAGMFRSRFVRSGGCIQVGQTTLCLECAPDGLASRSFGMVTESDFAWAVRSGARSLFRLGRGLLRFLSTVFGRLLGSWVAIGAIMALLYLTWPQFRYTVQRVAYYLYYRALLMMR